MLSEHFGVTSGMLTQWFFVALLLPIKSIEAASFSSVRLKFVSPPHIHEHGIATQDGRTIMQTSFLSVGRSDSSESFKRFEQRKRVQESKVLSDNQYSNEGSPDFSNGLDYPDPYLLTGYQALLAVKYLYGRGELFFHDIPHFRAVLQNQEQRRKNGLEIYPLRSIRVGSPFS